MGNPESFILWVNEVPPEAQLCKPHALFTAADRSSVANWRELNRWADRIPLIEFHADAGRGLAFMDPPHDESDDGIPWRVSGDQGVPILEPIREVDGIEQRMWHVVHAAAACAVHAQGPVWEILADVSGGMLSAGIAMANKGTSLAVGLGQTHALLAHCSSELGFSVSARKTPGKTWRELLAG